MRFQPRSNTLKGSKNAAFFITKRFYKYLEILFYGRRDKA